MRILVVGASQGTGLLAVQDALAKGHEVTAFARSADKIAIDHPKLTKIAGSFFDREAVEKTVPGHDAVIITASVTKMSAFKENPNYFSQGTELVMDAMKKHGVKRLGVLSAIGTNDSLPLLPIAVRVLLVSWILKPAFEDHERQETAVKASDLDWVIARPGRLTNGSAKRRYKKTAALEKVPSSIARADVADFLVDAVTSETWLGKSVQIGG